MDQAHHDKTTAASGAARQRRSYALRSHGGLVAPAKLSRDHIEMLIADGWLDMREVDVVRDDGKLNARLYAQACGAAVTRILDRLLKKTSRVRSKLTELD